MKVRRIALYALAIIFLAIITSVVFALYTETGTSIVIKAAHRSIPRTIDFKKMTGRLGYRIHIEGLTLHVSGNTVHVNSTDLQWHPVHIILGRLPIDYLRVKDVHITGARKEEKPVDLSLPHLPRWLSLYRAWVDNLAIYGLTYTSPDKSSTSTDAISASLLMDGGVLYLDRLTIKDARANINGVVILNLVSPGLRGKLSAAFREKTAGLDNILVNVNLPASRGKEQAAGSILVKAFAGKKERLRLECHVGLERQAIRIKDAKLTKADNGGNLDLNASIDLAGSKPAFDISGQLTKLNLAPEIPQETALSGDFRASGTIDDFQGNVSVSNAGPSWKNLAVRGNILGSSEVIRLQDLEAKIIGGTVLGAVELARASRTVTAEVTGKGFNPEKIKPGLFGNINFRLDGHLRIPGDEPLEGAIKAAVYNSTFQKRPLTADIDMVFTDELIKINSLSARGSGFTLNARGTVQERVTWLVRIDDASKISPGATGALTAQGWARWRDNEAAGGLTARGSNIAWNTLRVSSFDAGIDMPDGYEGNISANITASKLFYSVLRSDSLALTVKGTMDDHRISFVNIFEKDRIEALAEGAYADGAWEGRLTKISGREALYGTFNLQKPSTVRIARDGLSVSQFAIAGPGGEALVLNANLAFDPLLGSVDATWSNINLGRVNKLIGNARLKGRTSGNSHLEWLKEDRLIIKSSFTGTAEYSQGQLKPLKGDISSTINWDSRGLNAALNIDLGNQGRLNAWAVSKEPARFKMPGQGTVQGEWSGLDLAILQPLLGDTVTLKGHLSGSVKGNFLPENRFDLAGNTSLADGSFSWRTDKGQFSAPVREASLTMNWANSSFTGNTKMALGQFGSARADFKLPLPARFPVKMDMSGPLLVSANGEVNERGLITALFPGMVQETQGRLSFDVSTTGTAGDPRLNGNLNLRGASAYFPAAGMDLKDVNADVAFNSDRITVSSFVARSGAGQITITGTAQHSYGRISSFEAAIKGDRFQVVHLPELNMLVTPDITVKGDMKKITVRGSLLIPEALISEARKENMIKPSPDVVIVGQEEETTALPFALDLLVTVRMGDKVVVRAYGIDTRLAGNVDVAMTGPEDIRARGVINTVEGKFDAYGVKLNIQRGTVTFSGPVKEAKLDIQAVRWIRDPEKGNVAAGVLVTGPPSKPSISLYSRPSLPDMDIISYMVLGRPGGPGGQEDAALLAKAASGLLTGGKASPIQKALGFVDIDVSKQGTSDASQSIVKIGRYLSPKLYVSFGRSMSGTENMFTLRYRLTKKLDVESTVGNQAGGAIYYRVEFD